MKKPCFVVVRIWTKDWTDSDGILRYTQDDDDIVK